MCLNEHPDKLIFSSNASQPKDVLWIGNNLNKGLGIFSYSNYRFELLPCHDLELKLIIPVAVTGGDINFTLLAIWANHPADKGFQYVGQVWKALQHYKELLQNGPVILTGDFNSNTIWDKPKREGNHSTVVGYLKQNNIRSCYHQHFNQEQGKEIHPTHYLYRHKDKPYHLDYCFASEHFNLKAVQVGDHNFWSQYSDHVPLMVTFSNSL